MNRSKSAEFAQFSFVRDAKVNVIEFPSQAADERIMLVIDNERWAWPRRREILESFESEFQLLSKIGSDSISQVSAWGRDSEELFYVDQVLDGEPLPSYLSRTGRIPVVTVSEWMLQLIGVLESAPKGISSIEHFSTQTLQVVADRLGRVRPVFSEFHAWTKPGARVREHTRECILPRFSVRWWEGFP